ncbi:hypothetical protein K438DRAFT_1980403 [Mycena galopus ATCC 62051]|nr:hypothetical protein K438DRAFT_1993530 [Mycena galopus ATCC 62051]KAF8174371.1 hypothetical protein K438DRAFT_1980403 [Mycena galopus ATCC 62051]
MARPSAAMDVDGGLGGEPVPDGLPNDEQRARDDEQRTRNKWAQQHDEHWLRDNRSEWTPELGKVHAAFERGREWSMRGLEWALCIKQYFDFEGEWGFADGTAWLGNNARPQQVVRWIALGRRWASPPCMPEDMGVRDAEGSWVAVWWKWWASLQPKERVLSNDETLSHPV